jgi:hypothetical protein
VIAAAMAAKAVVEIVKWMVVMVRERLELD